MFYFDPTYLLFTAPALILAVVAQILVKSRFSKYAQIPSMRGLTGAQAAREMLSRNGLSNIEIEAVDGFLSDHYDPRAKTLRLSPDVYHSNSLAAIGVACHEAGHALQDAHGYAMLHLRSAIVPVTNVGSHLSYIVIMLGFLFHSQNLIGIGALLFSGVVGFALITLPVEWDASARAKVAMVETGIVTAQERDDAAKVLNAAFLTYLASAISALMTLLYYLMRAGLLGGRRNN